MGSHKEPSAAPGKDPSRSIDPTTEGEPSDHNEPVLFRAEYVAEYKGLPVRAKGIRELLHLGNNRYRLVSSARSMLANVTESSEFDLSAGNVIPTNYSYERTGLGKNKEESARFDWQDQQLSHAETTSPLSAGTLDKLSYQFKLRTDVARAIAAGDTTAILEYEIADEAKRKRYRFQIIGEEILQTPLGDLKTTRVNRLRDDDDRQTSLWLAIDHDFLLVKLKQTEQNRGFELNLVSATVRGNPIAASL